MSRNLWCSGMPDGHKLSVTAHGLVRTFVSSPYKTDTRLLTHSNKPRNHAVHSCFGAFVLTPESGHLIQTPYKTNTMFHANRCKQHNHGL